MLNRKSVSEAPVKVAGSVRLHVLVAGVCGMLAVIALSLPVCSAQVRCNLDAVGAPVPYRRCALSLLSSQHDDCPASACMYLSTAAVSPSAAQSEKEF